MHIPAGYQLHITTWENDGDAYNTKIISGLYKEDVKFYIAMAKQFYSRNSRKGGQGTRGNGSNTTEQLKECLEKAIKLSPPVGDEILKDIEELQKEPEMIWQWLCDEILGYPVDQYYIEEENFTRVFESFEVFFFPETVYDLTKDF